MIYEQNKNDTGLKFGRRFGNFDGTGLILTFYTREMDMVYTLNLLAIESYNLYTN